MKELKNIIKGWFVWFVSPFKKTKKGNSVSGYDSISMFGYAYANKFINCVKLFKNFVKGWVKGKVTGWWNFCKHMKCVHSKWNKQVRDEVLRVMIVLRVMNIIQSVRFWVWLGYFIVICLSTVVHCLNNVIYCKPMVWDSDGCSVWFNSEAEANNYHGGVNREAYAEDWEVVSKGLDEHVKYYETSKILMGGLQACSEASGIDQDSWDLVPDKSNDSKAAPNGSPIDSSNSSNSSNPTNSSKSSNSSNSATKGWSILCVLNSRFKNHNKYVNRLEKIEKRLYSSESKARGRKISNIVSNNIKIKETDKDIITGPEKRSIDIGTKSKQRGYISYFNNYIRLGSISELINTDLDNEKESGKLVKIFSSNILNKLEKGKVYRMLVSVKYEMDGIVKGSSPMKSTMIGSKINCLHILRKIQRELQRFENEYELENYSGDCFVGWKEWLSNEEYAAGLTNKKVNDILNEVIQEEEKSKNKYTKISKIWLKVKVLNILII